MIKTINKVVSESTKLFTTYYNQVIENLRLQGIDSISKDDYLTICSNISFTIQSNQDIDVWEVLTDTEVAASI